MNGLLSSAGNGERTAKTSTRLGLRRAAAGATAAVLLGLVICDVYVAGVRAWWDRHAFTSCVVSSLLVLGVTVLILDELLASRQRKERAGSVAVQAVIVYGQALQSCNAVMAIVSEGSDGQAAGGNEADLEDAKVNAHAEVHNLANMILVASPALFDDPEARLFLEEVQRFAATMYGALAMHRLAPVPPTDQGDDTLTRLRSGRSKLDIRMRPLTARLSAKDRAPLDALAELASRRSMSTQADG